MSVLVVPVLAGLLAGKRRGWGLPHALLLFCVYAVVYVAFLYYQYFRWR